MVGGKAPSSYFFPVSGRKASSRPERGRGLVPELETWHGEEALPPV